MSHKILICDDETHILRAAEFKFKRAGFDVECASDGEQAWQSIQQRHPDLLITDCQMPRLDGIGLAERIKNSDDIHDLPVLMLTAKGFELAPEQLREKYGILAVLSKPFSPRELLKRVTEILESRSHETAH